MRKYFDIIVIGGGHAGCEAASAAARLGSKTLMITMIRENIAQMSCNPAMGGVAKGQIVREIDALGGCSGIVTDHTMIQFRMLNRSKGPAMWSPRAQSDRMLFSQKWREILESTENLFFWQDSVVDIEKNNNGNILLHTLNKVTFEAKAVIIASGTFLNGKIYIGQNDYTGGRIGEDRVIGLTEKIKTFGIDFDRLKTGTPVRVDGRTIDFTKFIEQKGDENPGKFSYTNTPKLIKQRSCYIAYTNDKIHEILRKGFKDSPLFQGRIQGSGPRYCPSIEDKIERFSDKDRHQLFIEPEGWNSIDYYINGFSSSLPLEIQVEALTSISGFENAQILRPGYAVEYDFFPPTQLNYSLESKIFEGLFFAGQVNGTTGYEEAAAQGLMAGINAQRKINNIEPLILQRDEAYIGVLIDDLVTKGTNEPYRMFTSRAEFRILLRQDNADSRLMPIGHKIGLISDERLSTLNDKEEAISQFNEVIKKNNFFPQEINNYLEAKGTNLIQQPTRIYNILLRPQVLLDEIIEFSNSINEYTEKIKDKEYYKDVVECVEILVKYQGYVEKEKENA
ncbi:MAG: tRNA uridine-5-carboxymethylaminomethyl(34) synthesis enzyme MnmG, partial [Bacteroidetes bacterium]|nr:tRNA uridine-5-carboxymethylaminomethyl(34) synthesis enzyme MnmG [Bacteroidota bacterium]